MVRGSDEVLANYQTERDELSLPLFRMTDEIAAYQWDLDTVKKLHVEMSTEMNREVKALLELEQEPWQAQRAGTGLKAFA